MTRSGEDRAVTACTACRGGWPEASTRIATLSESSAYLHDDQFFPGWSILVLRRHATELFELEPDERARLMSDVSDVAHALKLAFDARKINYALFGNLVPHAHWHVIPRLAADPAPLEPVFAIPHQPVRLGEIERSDRIARIRRHLAR